MESALTGFGWDGVVLERPLYGGGRGVRTWTVRAKKDPPSDLFPYAEGGKAGVSKAEQGPRKAPQDNAKKKREVLVWQPQSITPRGL